METCFEYGSIIPEIAGVRREKLSDLFKMSMSDRTGCAIDYHQTGVVPLSGGLLCNPPGRQVVVEKGSVH